MGNGDTVRRVFFLVPVIAIAIGVAGLSAKRIVDKATAGASAEEKTRPPLSVKAVRAQRDTIRAWVYGQGTARSVRREFLVFEQQGKITYVKKGPGGRELREGDGVRGPAEGGEHGELLARLDDRDFVEDIKVAKAAVREAKEQENAVRADLDRAKVQRQVATTDLKRRRNLFEAQTITASEFELAQAQAKEAEAAVRSAHAQINAASSTVAAARARVAQAEVALERSRLFAPFDGIIAYLNIKEGHYFSPNFLQANTEEEVLQSIPMVLIDPSRFEITLDIPSFDGSKVQPEQPAFVLLGEDLSAMAISGATDKRAIEESLVRGKVFSVNPAVNPGGRSVQVKVRTTHGSERLRDGMFVTCWIVVAEKGDAVVLPYNAVVYRELDAYAFVLDEEKGIAEQRQVRTGIDGMDGVEIVDGIGAGAVVATEGRRRLTDGASVTVVEVVGDEVRQTR